MAKLTVELRAPNGTRFFLNTGLFINNEFVEASGGKLASISPINGQEICSVEAASERDVDMAVKAAEVAFTEGSEWSQFNGSLRGEFLVKLANLVEQHKRTLATIETWDNGKTYFVALERDLSTAVALLRFYADWADKLYGDLHSTCANHAHTLKLPVGVCGEIIPWNNPLMIAVSKLGPALAAGNTIVLKPAEQTPLSILYLADLIRQAGIPPGVVNIVNGYDKEAGYALASHPDLNRIAVAGSLLSGREMMSVAGSNAETIVIETGGRSPFIVFEDADLEEAAHWIYGGIVNNQGQGFMATQRVLVQDTIVDEFLRVFTEYITTNAKIGDPFMKGTTHSPLVSEQQYEKILSSIEGAKRQGARLILGGQSVQQGVTNGKGFYIQPTVFSNVGEDMDIFRDEFLGPIIPVSTFHDDKEAVSLATDTEQGLVASVFSEAIAKAHKTGSLLDVSKVWVNASNDRGIDLPPRGVRQGVVGQHVDDTGMLPYIKTKTVRVHTSNSIRMGS